MSGPAYPMIAPCSRPSTPLRAAFGGDLRSALSAAPRGALRGSGRDAETPFSRTKKHHCSYGSAILQNLTHTTSKPLLLFLQGQARRMPAWFVSLAIKVRIRIAVIQSGSPLPWHCCGLSQENQPEWENRNEIAHRLYGCLAALRTGRLRRGQLPRSSRRQEARRSRTDQLHDEMRERRCHKLPEGFCR